ncbi:hypothetical protein GO283_02663 [Ralstonia solanacearum]|uniref:Uncharacterized protein n=1 Tax=Ralstonia solanacearum TaxID=305 RepID=A0A0S4W9M3_RALSL|nr:hypothetical protein [Ralstonia solanacearum]NJZ78737.1 hypothetical protein [Ralstonia solanacearum]NKA03569.1 hypothetical protein [Ralstonia solanacearum]NKA14748.1 hypothetical protein [Ralstonia solanacearum]NKA34998.1 hypothetical protein [Ralstonia solanacearum]
MLELLDEDVLPVVLALLELLPEPCMSLTSFWKSDCSVDSALLLDDEVSPLLSCEIRLCRPDARSEP